MTKAHTALLILFALGFMALLPLVNPSNSLLNAMIAALIVALAAQGWNILGGYGGQFSFGHAAFFGSGAYADALLQTHLGLNAWVAAGLAIACGGLTGLIIGYLSFRSGLKGSYFALVTLAFAEVFRIIANASPVTGGAAGTLLKLEIGAGNFQFASRTAFYWVALGCVAAGLLLTSAIAGSRFGAYLVAVRENEDAAKALGVDCFDVKLKAITLSAALTALSGVLYVQYFLYVDSTIAFGPSVSIEALLAPIIGGVGTVFGPVLGALALHFLGESAKALAGRVPGIDLALYGCLLIAAIAFARQGVMGLIFKLSGFITRTAVVRQD